MGTCRPPSPPSDSPPPVPLCSPGPSVFPHVPRAAQAWPLSAFPEASRAKAEQAGLPWQGWAGRTGAASVAALAGTGGRGGDSAAPGGETLGCRPLTPPSTGSPGRQHSGWPCVPPTKGWLVGLLRPPFLWAGQWTPLPGHPQSLWAPLGRLALLPHCSPQDGAFRGPVSPASPQGSPPPGESPMLASSLSPPQSAPGKLRLWGAPLSLPAGGLVRHLGRGCLWPQGSCQDGQWGRGCRSRPCGLESGLRRPGVGQAGGTGAAQGRLGLAGTARSRRPACRLAASGFSQSPSQCGRRGPRPGESCALCQHVSQLWCRVSHHTASPNKRRGAAQPAERGP